MQDQEASPPAPPEAADSPASEPQPEPRPADSRRSVEQKTAEREERRKAHFERALAAAGKAPTEKVDEPDEDPDEPTDPADPPVDKDETEEQKSERLARLDKLKSHKHLAKAKDAFAGEIKKFEEERKDFERDRVKQQRINDAATEAYGPIVVGREQYRSKDFRSAKATVEQFFGDKFENISRNLWNATKDGMATADLRHEIESLKAKLAEGEQKTTQQKEAEATAIAEKQARADFGKVLKAHPLFDPKKGDPELQERAYDKWKESWDEDLGEYSLSKKKAADQVYQAELERAQRLTGKRVASVPRETRERGESPKPLREMDRKEKQKHHLERALRQTAALRRERERHA